MTAMRQGDLPVVKAQIATAPANTPATASSWNDGDGTIRDLLRELSVLGRRGGVDRPVDHLVDWQAVWASANEAPSDELALGFAAIAVEKALALPRPPAPSTLLADRISKPQRGSSHDRAAPAVELREEAPGITRPLMRGSDVIVERAREVQPGRARVEPHLSARARYALACATWARNVGLIIVLFAIWQLWGTGLTESQAQRHLGAEYASLVRKVDSALTDNARSPAALTVAPVGVPKKAAVAKTRTPGASHKGQRGAARAVSKGSGTLSGAGSGHVAAGDSPVVQSAGVGTTSRQDVSLVEPTMPGGVVGRVRIPAIGVDDYFVEGVGEEQLQEGPGLYPGSGLPGQVGNLAIAGHRTTYGAPFFRLDEVKVGDRVVIDVPEGRAVYKVSQPPFAVSPYDTSVLADFGDARLTLTTCNPPFFATTRLIVVAKLAQWLPVGARVTAPVARHAAAKSGKRLAALREKVRPPSVKATSRHLAAKGRGPAPIARPTAAGSTQAQSPRLPEAEEGPAGAATHGAPVLTSASMGEANGWHLSDLPIVASVALALCAFGALYDRLASLCFGLSRWLVMVPIWGAGLLALFKVLGLLLPADL
ncbi:MAG TPA: sortase [Acidimicrobiales bacterium]|nr:sortase [Acidimicrobiales bacterium]